MTWRCFLVGPNGTDYEMSEDFYPFEGMDEWASSIVEYWVISDYGLSEIVAQWLSQLGNAGIVGLYVSILVSLGALIRKVVPNAWYIVYMTLSDALRRITDRGHLRDEYDIWYTIMKIYRSPDLLCQFTKTNPTYGVVCDEDDLALDYASLFQKAKTPI